MAKTKHKLEYEVQNGKRVSDPFIPQLQDLPKDDTATRTLMLNGNGDLVEKQIDALSEAGTSMHPLSQIYQAQFFNFKKQTSAEGIDYDIANLPFLGKPFAEDTQTPAYLGGAGLTTMHGAAVITKTSGLLKQGYRIGTGRVFKLDETPFRPVSALAMEVLITIPATFMPSPLSISNTTTRIGFYDLDNINDWNEAFRGIWVEIVSGSNTASTYKTIQIKAKATTTSSSQLYTLPAGSEQKLRIRISRIGSATYGVTVTNESGTQLYASNVFSENISSMMLEAGVVVHTSNISQSIITLATVHHIVVGSLLSFRQQFILFGRWGFKTIKVTLLNSANNQPFSYDSTPPAVEVYGGNPPPNFASHTLIASAYLSQQGTAYVTLPDENLWGGLYRLVFTLFDQSGIPYDAGYLQISRENNIDTIVHSIADPR